MAKDMTAHTTGKMTGNIVIRSGLDRLRYTLLFEAILLGSSTAAMTFILQRDLLEMGYLALVISLIAMLTNYFYNYAYDYFDTSRGRIPTERTLTHRIYHALGFELLLLFFTLPLIMWWLEMSFINTLLLDIGMMAAVVVYTFLFGLGYDRVFPIKQAEQLIISEA